MAKKYAPYEVYKNLHKMMGYRGVEIDLVAYPLLTEDKFISQISHKDWIYIGSADKKTLIILLNIKTYVLDAAEKFEKLVKSSVLVMKTVTNMIIISEDALEKRREKQLSNLKQTYNRIYIEHHPYLQFKIEMPKHVSYLPHAIVDAKDVEFRRFQEEYMFANENMPKISKNDTACVWIGARAGQIVRIERVSETGGVALYYRLVIN